MKGSREKLKTLSTSWTNSIKRNSVDAPYIDGLGVKNKSLTGAVDEAPPKKFVAARNRLEESDDSELGHDEEDENEVEKHKNEFVIDEAGEATDGYESGDSMQSEERQEIEENEIIEDGISLGSEDTGSDYEDDDEMNSFIASDDDVAEAGSGEDEFDRLVAKPKYKRLVVQSSSESEDDDGFATADKETAPETFEETTTTVTVKKIQIEKTITETSQSIQIVVGDTATDETTQSSTTTRRSVQIKYTNDSKDGSVLSKESEPDSIVGESDNQTVNKSGFEETDRSPPVSVANKSMSGSKKRNVNVSMSFMEEDAADENVDTGNESVGKVAAEFVESENAPTPEKASEPTEEAEMDEQESGDSDKESDDVYAKIQYSLNKSHPKIAEIVASAFTGGLDSLLGDSISSDEDGVSAPSDKTVKKSVTVDVLPSSESEDDKIFYTFNKTHPANETLLRMMRASPKNLDASKVQADQEEITVPTVLNSSTGIIAKAKKSAENFVTPKQGKENLSANQLAEAVRTAAVNRSLQDVENTSAVLKPFLKKSANRSFGEMDTNQTLQVNTLSTHFDANASNLRRSSTPKQKALLKTQSVSAPPKAAKPIEIGDDASNQSALVESAISSKTSEKTVPSAVVESKSPPEANNNEKNSLTGEFIWEIFLFIVLLIFIKSIFQKILQNRSLSQILCNVATMNWLNRRRKRRNKNPKI